MLEGPFSTDKKFIRFMNEKVVHFVYLQGAKKETINVKVDGEIEVRSRFVPQLSPETIDEIGRDMMTWLRSEDAIKDWPCPRFEIWTANKKMLHAFGQRSRFIPPKPIMNAVKEAQKALGPSMRLKAYQKAKALLDQADAALEKGESSAAKKVLDKLERVKGLTPAFRQEIAERREETAAEPASQP
jgi:hypothetical protein